MPSTWPIGPHCPEPLVLGACSELGIKHVLDTYVTNLLVLILPGCDLGHVILFPGLISLSVQKRGWPGGILAPPADPTVKPEARKGWWRSLELRQIWGPGLLLGLRRVRRWPPEPSIQQSWTSVAPTSVPGPPEPAPDLGPTSSRGRKTPFPVAGAAPTPAGVQSALKKLSQAFFPQHPAPTLQASREQGGEKEREQRERQAGSRGREMQMVFILLSFKC